VATTVADEEMKETPKPVAATVAAIVADEERKETTTPVATTDQSVAQEEVTNQITAKEVHLYSNMISGLKQQFISSNSM